MVFLMLSQVPQSQPPTMDAFNVVADGQAQAVSEIGLGQSNDPLKGPGTNMITGQHQITLVMDPTNFTKSISKGRLQALAGVAQWTECWPMNQKVSGSMPN